MLEHALSKTFASLSTLFLVAAVLTAPVHLVHAFLFRDVLAVVDLRSEIDEFPETRQVRGVARSDLDTERYSLLLVVVAEALALPLLVRAARRVIAVDDTGGVSTVRDALAHLRKGGRTNPTAVKQAAIVGLIAAPLAWLVWQIGGTIVDAVSRDARWAIVGLGRAASAALFMALVAGAAAATARSPETSRPIQAEDLELY